MISLRNILFVVFLIMFVASDVACSQSSEAPRPSSLVEQPKDLQARGTVKQLKALPYFKNLSKLDELHTAAVDGRSKYQMMVNRSNFKQLGLARVSDAKKTKLGTPTRDYLVRLDHLKNYKAGDDPSKLLTNTGMVHYPIELDNKVCSTITLAMEGGQWKPLSIGEAQRSQKRKSALMESSKKLSLSEESYFIVRVPALNLEFVAVTDSSGALQLTPILDQPAWELQAGVPEPASSVLLRLVPAAKGHNGLPW